MAVDIARYFRLDTVGLDFITPDISKSWREVGVVIEVNYHPGMRDELAYIQLTQKFPKNNGRIPILLLVAFEPQQQQRVFEGCVIKEPFTGFVSADSVHFLGVNRLPKTSSIHRRCLPLIKDVACKELIVAVTLDEIIEQGLPLDLFDHCYITKQAHSRASEVGLLSVLQNGSKQLKLV